MGESPDSLLVVNDLFPESDTIPNGGLVSITLFRGDMHRHFSINAVSDAFAQRIALEYIINRVQFFDHFKPPV
jgi:hypothetical protein